MGVLAHKIKLTPREVEIYQTIENVTYSPQKVSEINNLVKHIAISRSNYHPMGYGIFNERIEKENNEYFACWGSYDSCD